jgi:hypothetical protein
MNEDRMKAELERNDDLEVCRDATYGTETQEHLRDLLREVLTRARSKGDPRVHALADVIWRWDDNPATETTFSRRNSAEIEAYLAGMESALGITTGGS